MYSNFIFFEGDELEWVEFDIVSKIEERWLYGNCVNKVGLIV